MRDLNLIIDSLDEWYREEITLNLFYFSLKDKYFWNARTSCFSARYSRLL